jgi:hypothetical protein
MSCDAPRVSNQHLQGACSFEDSMIKLSAKAALKDTQRSHLACLISYLPNMQGAHFLRRIVGALNLKLSNKTIDSKPSRQFLISPALLSGRSS